MKTKSEQPLRPVWGAEAIGKGQADDDEPAKPLDLVWGAAAIGRVINRNTHQTFHGLETGAIPGRKVGGLWVSGHSILRDFFLGAANE